MVSNFGTQRTYLSNPYLRINLLTLDLLGKWKQLQAAHKRQDHLWHPDRSHFSDGLLPAERHLHPDLV